MDRIRSELRRATDQPAGSQYKRACVRSEHAVLEAAVCKRIPVEVDDLILVVAVLNVPACRNEGPKSLSNFRQDLWVELMFGVEHRIVGHRSSVPFARSAD